MSEDTVALSREKETPFVPLCGKALESRRDADRPSALGVS